MKVIFLDIDGVLNVIGQGRDQYGALFHKHFEDNLNYIINSTGAKIVISSTWRMSGLEEMQNMWKDRNLPGDVIDITPISRFLRDEELTFDERKERGNEIKTWLLEHPEIINYVILDDDTDMLDEQLPYFVQCSENQSHIDCIDIGYGLTKECTEQAIKILNKII